MQSHIFYNDHGNVDENVKVIESPSHFTSEPFHFLYNETNVKPGYIEEKNYISFISDRIKVIAKVPSNTYHFLVEFIGELSILIDLLSDKELEFIIDTYSLREEEREYFCSVITNLFESRKVRYRYINSLGLDYININNFITLNISAFSRLIPAAAKTFEDIFDLRSIAEPSRKVYISRRETINRIGDQNTFLRIDNELVIEQIFLDKGFEIVYAEKFKTMKEKALFFRDVKVLAGLTGAGLANIIFMKPEQVVIEIVTAQFFPQFAGKVFSQEIHNFYRTVCFNLDHVLINIQNQRKISDNITKVLKSIAV